MKSKYKGSISTKHFQIYDADSFETKMVIGFDEAYSKLSSHAALVSALEGIVAMQDSIDPEGFFEGVEMAKCRAALAFVKAQQ